MDTEQAQAAADRLSTKLDALELDEDERGVLTAILAAGASSFEPGDDVQGFAVDAFIWFTPGPAPAPKADTPTESVSLNFSKIEWTWTQQR